MKYILTLFIFVCISFFPLQSQVKEITGSVKSKSGPLSGVVITVTTEADDNVLVYAITNHEGRFTLKNVDISKGKFIHARMLGFALQKHPLTPDRTDYTFVLTEEAIRLNEVQIKAVPITGAGDTTRYLASSFARKNDITLGDVLKRMPGFHVSEGGRIKYNGKDISNFYIEGSDIMGGKYPVAVKSVRHDDVGSVEVIENHQSVKLFEDLLFSDNTAVNITLKEKAKNRWVGMVNAGGGIPRQWNVDINAMRFTRKVKMLNTYKGNNTGDNVSAIGTSVPSSDESDKEAREIIVPQSVRNPYLEERKTLFNKSHLLSLNSQLPIGKSLTLTPQLEMSRSTFENTIEEEKHYFLENGRTLHIVGHENGKLRQHGISPTLRLESNTRKMYLFNVLSSDIKWRRNDFSATGTYPNEVSSRMDYTHIRNLLNLMFRTGRKVVGIRSENRWSRRPQHIDILQNDTLIYERIETSAFYSHTSATQSFVFGIATLSLEEGYIFSRHLLQSRLEGLTGFDSPENDFDYRHTQLYAKPSLSLRRRVWSATLSVPLSYRHTAYENRLAKQSYHKNRWLLSPSVSTVWTADKHWSVSLNGGWKRLPEHNNHFYTSPLLSSYPYLQTGTTNYLNPETAHVGTLIRYKNILQGLFGNIGYNRLWQHSNLMPSQDFGGAYIVTGFVRRPYSTRSDNVLGSISYMLDAIRGSVTLKGIYASFESRFMQNGKERQATSTMWQLSVKMDSSPSGILDIDYMCVLSNNAYRIREEKRQNTHTAHQRLSLTVIPKEVLNFVVTGNHYYNTLGERKKHTFLLDANVNYRLSSLWSFRLTAQNLFDRREFSYISYTDMMSIERTYRIRPFSLLFSVITSF